MTADVEDILIKGSIADLQSAYTTRRLSVSEAVRFYLARIEALSRNGLGLNAVRSVAGDALAVAARADEALAVDTARGPLFGIPVLLKDNILTDDGMPASAGAAALAGFVPQRAATLVHRLRRAGAIVLGKTNMTEFADYVSDVMPSEFSGAGGVVANPHSCRYDRGQGSSVGSAAAVAASLAPIAIGSETQNSIQMPASVTSVFGFKPTVGLVSRAGVVPLVPSQDSPGPLARSVGDAARVVAALSGADSRDSLSLFARPDLVDSALMTLAPCDLKLGVLRRTFTDRAELESVMPQYEAALSKLARAGATLIDPCDLPSADALQAVRSSVFRTQFKAALDDFLTDHGAPCGIASLNDLIAWNEKHPEAVPYGQGLLLAAQATAGFDDPQYRLDRVRDLALSRSGGIEAALSLGAQVLIAPMGTAAKCSGKAGSPVLAIPVGIDPAGLPFGVTLLAAPGQDALLLAVGAAVASVIGDRRVPQLHDSGAASRFRR